MNKREYTNIELEDDELAISCNDCGAFVIATDPEDSVHVVHHKSCNPGECARMVADLNLAHEEGYYP